MTHGNTTTSAQNVACRSQVTSTQFSVLVGITLLDGIGLGIILPLMPFLVMHFSGSPVVVTQLVALYHLAGFVGGPVLGTLSDRIGRGRVLLVSLVASFVSYLGILLSWSLIGVFTFRFLSGFLAGRVAVMQAAVTSGPEDAGHVDRISWLLAASTIGTAGGPVIAGLITLMVVGETQQFRLTLWAAALLTLVAAIALAWVSIPDDAANKNTSASERSVGSAFRRNLLLPLSLTITTSFGQGVILSTTALLVHFRFGWGVGQTGLLLGLVAGAMAAMRVFVLPRLAKRLGSEPCLLLCNSIAIPCLVAMALTHNAMLFCFFIAIFSCANGMSTVLPTTIVSMRAEKHERGYALGVNRGAVAIAMCISASGNGFLFDFVAPGAPLLVGALIMSIGFILLFVELARQRYQRLKAKTKQPRSTP